MNYQPTTIEADLTMERTLKAQRKIQAIERKAKWLLTHSHDAAEPELHGITPEAMQTMQGPAQALVNAAKDMHDAMNKAAATSSLGGMAELLGPGRKGDDG